MGDPPSNAAVATLDNYNDIFQQAVQALLQEVPAAQQKQQLTDKASNYVHGFPNALPDVSPQLQQGDSYSEEEPESRHVEPNRRS